MKDYISRQAAIDFIDAGRLGNPNEPRWSDNEVANFLKSRPSADVRPNARGEWVKGGEQPYFRKHFDIVVCSVCNKRGEQRWNFCPNCGADMRTEAKE